QPRRDLAADDAPERDAGVGDLAALLLHLLALVVIERREVVAEIAVTRIFPPKLDAMADDHPGIGAEAGFLGAGKEDVQRRRARVAAFACRAQERDGVLEQRAARRVVVCEQPGSRCWSEGNGRDELRIVTATVTAEGVGPRPVEHVFAV